MTTTAPAVFGQFGQALAFAEQTLTATLRAHLAERDTKPETWYALQLLGARGPGLSREELSHGLERSRTLNADATRELLERLEAEGLICGDTHVDLLSQFDLHDIETTVRILQAITKRAAEESSGSAS